MRILGVDVDNLTRDEIHAQVEGFLREDRFHRVATVNPEFLVEAHRSPTFHESLHAADLRIADGFGIAVAFRLRRGKLKCRYPGADLTGYILAKAERECLPVFFAVRKGGLSSFPEIREALLEKYPGLIVDGEEIDGYRDAGYEISDTKYRILLCNFGAPSQEIFLESFREDPKGIRLAIGIGGTADFLTGKQRRAPRWIRMIGLEWLWRLVLRPKRIGRIWNAVAVFPWIAFLEKKNPR